MWFRKGYSTQYSLIVMIEKWKKVLDNVKLAGAYWSLSKAFDCLNHNLMIVKLHAYGFDHNSILLPMFIVIFQVESRGQK